MELWRALKSPRLGKISAPSKNLSGKVWRPLTIWARQNLQLLTSSWSGWRNLVQILVDVLPLRHVDLKRSEGSGRSVFMGCVSPVLYRLVVPARPVKISAGVQNLGGCANFYHFLWKLKNSISASKCPITAPKICIWSLLLSKFSYHTHSLQNGGHPRLWARLPKYVHNPLGGGGVCWGGLSLSPLILITWPQAVLQTHRVGKGGRWRGGERGDMQQITAYSNSHPSFSLYFCPLCIRRGFDKNFARSSAEHIYVMNFWHF